MNPRDFMVLLLFWLVPFFFSGGSATAKPSAAREGPPVLPPVELKVEGRLPLRIVLKASGLRLSPVKFLIRKDPLHGKLRFLRQLAGDSAEVEYLPPEDLSITEDFFWFAGGNAMGFSSDTRAHIVIKDIGPRLQVSLALDFPATRVGQSSWLPLEVSNSGDQPAKGSVVVEPPWEIEKGAEHYELEPGNRVTVGVFFKPAKPGWAQAHAQLKGDAPASVQLRGEALDWVEVARDPVPLFWSGARQQRGELNLSNFGSDPLDLVLQASPALEHETRIRIEPGTVRDVPLKWPGGAVPGGWGTLLLSSPTGMRRVLVWTLDATLSGLGTPFVLGNTGELVRAQRTFRNIGGRGGTWTFQCTRPFSINVEPPAGSAEAPTKGVSDPPSKAVGEPKKNAEQAAKSGLVWNHNLNRRVQSGGPSKPPVDARAVKGGSAASTPQEVQPTGATTVAKNLQPGEDFVLVVSVKGSPAGAVGTLFVEGPGLSSHKEAIVLREESGRERPKSMGASPASDPVVRPPAMSPGAGLAGGNLPPVLAPSAMPGVAPAGKGFPSLFPNLTRASKPRSTPMPEDLRNSFFPEVVYKGMRVKDITSHGATLVFPVGPGVEPGDLIVRYGEILADNDANLSVKWNLFDESNRRGRRIGNEIEIRLRGLVAGGPNYVDLLGPLVNGGRDKVFGKEIFTPPPSALFSPRGIWQWLVLAIALGVAISMRYKSKRRLLT